MFFFPQILIWFTGKPRYLPKINWSSNSWTHNIFRFYEKIFWRRHGIKAEAISLYTRHKDRITITYKCISFESIFALIEQVIRGKLKRFKVTRVWIPKLAVLPGFAKMAGPFMFAITFDTNTFNAAHQQNTSFNHTCTGSDLYLVLCTEVHRTPDYHLSGITYNSVAMTSRVTNNDGCDTRIWDLVNPTTGTNSVAITGTNSDTWHEDCALSFSGVKQSGQPDNTAVISAPGVGQTSVSWDITTIADNCWCVTGLAGPGLSISATAGTYVGSNPGSVQFGQQIFYAGPKTPAGTLTTSFTCTASTFPYDFSVLSFAPTSEVFGQSSFNNSY